jgi:intein/homing endonuclease
MARNVATAFQELTRIFTGNWQSPNDILSTPAEASPEDVVYKTEDPVEYKSKMLELQQNKYLQNRWKRVNQNLSMSAFAGLSNVKLMYRDADLMDAYPEIGAALDILSEEATLTTGSEEGMIVNVSSSSDRIKSILEDLFVNRLNMQVTAQMVMRGMVKYGNEFMLLDIDKKLGIKGWRRLPVGEVERIENGIVNPYGAPTTAADTSKDDMTTKFLWTNEIGGTMVPFRNWQIAHFRLLHNSMFLPYGCLVGDTRIETEFGFKEIKDIKIGDKVWTFNVDSQQRELADVTMHMNKGVKDVFEVQTKHNYIVGTEDHKLLCYQNGELQYKEIKDIEQGDLLIVDNSTNKCSENVKIDKSIPSENETNTYHWTGWWNRDINYIPDYVDEKFARFFGFMLGDGFIHDNKVSFACGEYPSLNKEFADYLESITSKKIKWSKSFKDCKTSNGFLQGYVNSKCLSLIMRRMGFYGKYATKRCPQWIYSCNDSIKKAFLNGIMTADGSYNIDKYGCLRCGIELGNEQLIKDIKILAQTLGYKTGKICYRVRPNVISDKLGGGKIKEFCESYYFYFYESFNKQEKKYDLENRLQDGFKTEKVISKEFVGKKETFDITVSNDNSNFFANGIVTHNCSALMAARRHFRMLALMEDMMLIYRLERSMERRVYKIFVGALDDADIPAFIENIADQFKRTPIVDPLTGQLDLRKNILPVWKKTPIPLVDGRVITIEQLAKEFEQGKKNKVYSVQKGTNKVVEGNVVWCGKTGHPDNLYEVTFYNNTHMVLAAEHEVMLLNGKMKRADQLKPGEEIMPFSMERKDNTRQTFSNETYYTVKKVDVIEGDDVYCMTVEGDTAKTKDDRHNFALLTFTKDGEANDKGGCFVSNCASDDIFIPVRDPNTPTPIETLAGAKNLDAIDDIKYIQKKVCAALRIPQSFLNFEEQKGDGKNLALMDVRFARTVNKFQQAFLMELTKIATIHLYLLGFEDDLTNFTLTMNNPSTQSEQLEIENLQKKITAVRDAVSDPGGGIPAMSLTRALKTIMKWSEKDIKENFEEIRLERALSAELEKTAEIIKRTGIFDTVDRIYGEPNAQYQESQGGQEGMDGMGGPSGGGGGGFGGGIDDFGAPGAEGEDVMGEEGTEPTAEMGGTDTAPQGPDQQPMENIVRMKPLIKEYKDNRGTQIILNRLFESIDKRTPKPVKRVDVYDKTLMINEDINKAIGLIDEYTKEDGIKPTEDDE